MSAMCQDATADPSATIAELRRERDAALARETALAELLQIINSSPGDPAPVFDAILEKATRLCEAACGQIATYDGEQFRWVAVHGDAPFVAEQLAREPMPPSFGVTWPRIVGGEGVVNIADLKDTDLYRAGHEGARGGADIGGARSLLSVALRKEDVLLGILTVYRQEVRPFTEREIALLQNFAAQAVIAMENARLLGETREALEQQTATGEVLQVISRSTFDLEPVLEAVVAAATRLCSADAGLITIRETDGFRVVRSFAVEPGYDAAFRGRLIPVTRGTLSGRTALEARVVHIADLASDSEYTLSEAVELGPYRSVLGVPLLRDGVVIGTINLARNVVQPFTDKQIKLVGTFAAQAVIAMENARLLTETREALEQQTATAEVLGVINASPGDLAPVFDAILEKAVSLTEAVYGHLWRFDGEHFHPWRSHGDPQFAIQFEHLGPVRPNPDGDGFLGRVVRGEQVLYIADVRDTEAYRSGYAPVTALADVGGGRSVLTVALRKDHTVLGVLTVYRREVKQFSEKQISLLQNFAAQAVIAMENARLLTETREDLEQQTATSEVLQVINSSQGDLTPVFDAVLEKATRACDAAFGTLWTYDGERFQAIALRQVPEAYAEFLSQAPIRPIAFSGLGRVAAGESVAHFVDVAANEAYRGGDPQLHALLDLGRARSTVAVPLRKDNVVLGAITAYRQEVRPFSGKQIALLQNFAAQAVIAMENARLLTETREALEQQTATAEVLGVINSSPGDLAPVFDAMLDKAMRLCGVDHAALELYDGERFRAVAVHGASDRFADMLRQGYRAADSPASRTLLEGGRFVQIADAAQVDLLTFRAAAELDGVRTVLFVPLRRDDALLGMIASARREVRLFSDKEIALLENFAAQAVIAMENARLLTETREALAQQTATAEVLQIINSSPGDLAPVFDAMLDKATTLCGAAYGTLFTYDGKCFNAVALRGVPDLFANALKAPVRPEPGAALDRLIRGERFADCADIANEPSYRGPGGRALMELGGARSTLAVPLRRDDVLLGVFAVYRQEVRPFTEKQIALLQNFAAQAVIAMENARLLTETREALARQTATAEVLQVINSSPGDLAPVFDAILEKAHSLCGVAYGSLHIYDGERFHAAATHNLPEEFVALLRQGFRGADNPVSRPLLDGARLVHIPDLAEIEDPTAQAAVELGGIRTALFLPLRRDDALLGMIVSARPEVRLFADREIALLQNFSAQAVIAMENARLLIETREALEQQTATAEVLQVINSSPGDLAPVFDAMLEKAMRLCEAHIGFFMRYEGQKYAFAAGRGLKPEFAEYLARMDQPGPDEANSRVAEGAPYFHVVDMKDDEPYRLGSPFRRATVDLGGGRTGLGVPMRKDKELLGTFSLIRCEVRPFSDKQIALVQNFAAQAVIAMENARLLTETREALEQQTATAEVLQVINASPGDLAPVFDTMLEKAMRLCEAAFGLLNTYDGEHFHTVAVRGVPAAFAARLRSGPRSFGPGTGPARMLAGEHILFHLDLKDEDIYRNGDPNRRALVDIGGARSSLQVALLKDETFLGFITVFRREVRPFSDKQIALLQNFAAQAVIAMENARLLNETREALAQETATTEVLQVINSSPGDLAPVFDTILEKAHSLCGVAAGSLQIKEGNKFRAVAMRGVPDPVGELLRRPFEAKSGAPASRLLAGEPFVHIADMLESSRQRPDNPRAAMNARHGLRTVLFVPLRKDNDLLGYISAYRFEVRAFADKQIALLQNFAAQAVIAMENARLLTETREALEYQTATSDVLQVISRSTFDLDPVLEYVIETAIRLCRAHMGSVFRLEDGLYRWAVGSGLDSAYREIEQQNPIAPGTHTLVGRVALEGRSVQIADAMADPDYAVKDEARLTRAHTMLGVPLLREGAPIGVIAMARDRVEPFTDKEVTLVTTFADQAVIAMENARLLNDLQGRTRDLQESLEYQTATSDVLKVISRSAGELDPVLQTLVETAARLCDAKDAFIFQLREDRYRIVASFGFTPEHKDFIEHNPFGKGRGTVTGRADLDRRVVHVPDVANDPEYTWVEGRQSGQFRTALGVPLLRDDMPIGVLFLSRSRVAPFTDKQVALITTFADQAVIAIENARLFNELRQRTAELGRSVDELKMLSEVGQAVSSTLDLRAVLATILTRSVGLTGADAGAVFRYNRAERTFRLVEAAGWEERFAAAMRDVSVAEAETAMSEAAARRAPIQLADLAQRPTTPLVEASLAAGLHSALIVPLVGPERTLGALVLQRRQAGEFPAETVRLMQTLASQSVLAIQNARLFREIAEKSEQLALASEHKSQFLANMSHELRTPLNAILGYAELLVDGIYGVLPEKAQGVLERVQNNGKHLLALINDVLDLAKIEAGQLALTIEDYSLPELVKTVAVATEPLAAAKGLKFTSSVEGGMPRGHGDARRLAQVLLNLVGNAIKFTDAGEVEIRAALVTGQFVLTVRDTGPGIADADQDRIFGEFQQIDNADTRKKGGTGLGLAISKRMVEMQGGMISVESVLGQGSTFRVVMPVEVEPALEAAAE